MIQVNKLNLLRASIKSNLNWKRKTHCQIQAKLNIKSEGEPNSFLVVTKSVNPNLKSPYPWNGCQKERRLDSTAREDHSKKSRRCHARSWRRGWRRGKAPRCPIRWGRNVQWRFSRAWGRLGLRWRRWFQVWGFWRPWGHGRHCLGLPLRCASRRGFRGGIHRWQLWRRR